MISCPAPSPAPIEHEHNFVTMTTMKNPGIFGNEKHNKMAAVKHRISVIGLLKDVEFHMIKGAAEVYLGISVKYVPGKYGLRLSSYLLFMFLTSESF